MTPAVAGGDGRSGARVVSGTPPRIVNDQVVWEASSVWSSWGSSVTLAT